LETFSVVSQIPVNCMIKSRMIWWAVHVTRMGGVRNAFRVLVGEPEGRWPLGNL